MFHDIDAPKPHVGSRKAYVVPVSVAVHVVVVAAVFILPLMAPALLPEVSARCRCLVPVDVFLPPPPPPPSPREPVRSEPRQGANLPPTGAPDGIAPERPPVENVPTIALNGGLVGGCEDCTARLREAAPAPPPPPPPADPATPRRIGGDIRPPAKIKDVAPEYPAIALAARAQGVVIIEATVSVEGRVVDARVLRSVPLLDDAALAAVRQWQYTPTLLNGVPVPVVMTVTVRFSLD